MAKKRYGNVKTKSSILNRGLRISQTYNINSNTTVIYSVIPKSDSDIYVLTQPGDRLDLLANQFYGDVNLWWYIAKANGLTFMTIPTGTKLRIPQDARYAIGK